MLSLNPSQLAARLKAPLTLITGTRIPNTLPTHKACWEAILFPWPLGRSPRSTLLVFPQSLRDTLHTSTYSSKRKNFAIGWATVGCNVSCLFDADMRSAVSLQWFGKAQAGWVLFLTSSASRRIPNSPKRNLGHDGLLAKCNGVFLDPGSLIAFQKPRNLLTCCNKNWPTLSFFFGIPPRPIQPIIVHNDSTPPKGEPCPRTLFSSASAMADLEERRQHLRGTNASGSCRKLKWLNLS